MMYKYELQRRVLLRLSLLLFVLLTGRVAEKPPISTKRAPIVVQKNTKWDAYLGKLFRSSDLDTDGTISFDECYIRVLIFYIRLNREAHISPPSRSTVLDLYEMADQDKNRRLNELEFKRLANTLASRAATRLLVSKLITVLVAPFVATLCVHSLQGTTWVHQWSERVWDWKGLPTAFKTLLTAQPFWTTIFMILTISQTANRTLALVDAYLNRYQPFATKFLEPKQSQSQNRASVWRHTTRQNIDR